MKKLLLFGLAIICSLNLMAQLEVKEGTFKEVPGFVNINTDDNYQYDDNDLPFAVIKVRTENINDKQRRNLSFKGNAGTQIVLDYQDGEVWVYLTAKYADYLKISHPDFSSIEFTLPYDLKPKCGYEMTLVNKTVSTNTGSGSLRITTQPENGAEIVLNGKVLNQKTPYNNEMIPIGKYKITVKKQFFEPVTKTVEIKNGDSLSIMIDMPRAYGNVRIDSDPSEADILIDDNEFGTTPMTINLLQGSHKLILRKSGCRKFEKTFILEEDVLELDEKLETLQESEMVFLQVDEMPEFPGGYTKLFEYVQKNLKYPIMARESNIQGRVFVQFIIEKDGSISNVKVLQGIGEGCDEEAIRLVENMPQFKPGRNNGKPVRVQYTLPIMFALP